MAEKQGEEKDAIGIFKSESSLLHTYAVNKLHFIIKQKPSLSQDGHNLEDVEA